MGGTKFGRQVKTGSKAGKSLKQWVLVLTPLKLTDKFRGII
jgi:hypothetical protein